MRMPATAGPMARATLTMTEFRVTALASWSRPTISTMKVCRVGLSTMLIRPRSDRHQVQLPELEVTGEVEPGQNQGLQPGEGLGPEQYAVLPEAVGEGPADRPEQQDRQGLYGHDEADLESGLGQGEHQPGLGDALHPGPDQRQALAGEVVAEVADAERREMFRPASLAPRSKSPSVTGRHGPSNASCANEASRLSGSARGS